MDDKRKAEGESDSLIINPRSEEALISRFAAVNARVVAAVMSTLFSLLLSVALSFYIYHELKGHNTGVSASQVSSARPLKVLDKPLVILISSDGFRWGYQWKVPTPNIDRLRINGTQAFPGMIPVYPSVTFPNHYSIVTGLYPAWHGIINNKFRDPEPGSNDSFSMGNLNPKWWLGEPLWETVANAGLEAATYFWPGSEVLKGKWNCSRTSLCARYNESVPFEQRVDTVLSYMDLPNRPSFVTLYFEDPDETGHRVGPDAPQIDAAITRIDSMIGRLLDGLEKRNILDDATVILVGDHGMVGTCDLKVISLQDLDPWVKIDKSWVDVTSPILGIRPPVNVDVKSVVEKMRAGLASGKVENGGFLQVFLREDLPERLHYRDSDRIQPIIGMVSEGYKVELKRSKSMECAGAHGYDNQYLSMRTVFFAHGPRFQRGRSVDSFENVEIYNVITSILGIRGAPNNGSQSFADSILLPQV